MAAIGVVETNSIPQGVFAGDAMLKAAQVVLCAAQTTCPGKYVVMVSGDVAAVKAAVDAGVMGAGASLIDSVVIPSVDEGVVAAMNGAAAIDGAQALGLVETFSLVSAVLAADTAVKTAQVELVEVRLGRGMGGKSFVIFTGEVASVEAACKAIEHNEDSKGLIGSSVVIPSPHRDMMKALL